MLRRTQEMVLTVLITTAFAMGSIGIGTRLQEGTLSLTYLLLYIVQFVVLNLVWYIDIYRKHRLYDKVVTG